MERQQSLKTVTIGLSVWNAVVVVEDLFRALWRHSTSQTFFYHRSSTFLSSLKNNSEDVVRAKKTANRQIPTKLQRSARTGFFRILNFLLIIFILLTKVQRNGRVQLLDRRARRRDTKCEENYDCKRFDSKNLWAFRTWNFEQAFRWAWDAYHKQWEKRSNLSKTKLFDLC